MKTPIAERQFIIQAPPERVWGQLGRTIYGCLPLEKIDVVSETTIRAVLRWRLAFISLPLNLRLELTDISPPNSLSSKILVKKGILQLVVTATFTLTPVNQDKTEVSCAAVAEGGGIVGLLMRGQQRSFTANMFDSIRARLEQLR